MLYVSKKIFTFVKVMKIGKFFLSERQKRSRFLNNHQELKISMVWVRKKMSLSRATFLFKISEHFFSSLWEGSVFHTVIINNFAH